MEYFVTADEMKTYDNNTINTFGVESLVLMERAALGVSECILSKKDCKRILVLCGSGNNGGDGFAIARILHTRQLLVSVLFAGSVERMSRECRVQYESVMNYHIPLEHAGSKKGEMDQMEVESSFLDQPYDCIVDALFGVSLNRPIEGIYSEILSRVNKTKAYKVAVDIPSGIHADTGLVMGNAFRADETITFAFKKAGLLLGEAKEYCGKISCVDIGITRESFLDRFPGQFSYQKEDIRRVIPVRSTLSHKGSFGKVLLIAGSKEIGGACLLSVKSLLRSGCGYVRVLTHEANRNLILLQVPEALLTTYGDDGPQDSLLRQVCESATVIVAGPGITRSDTAKKIVQYVVNEETKPLVIDADAINVISENEDMKKSLEQHASDCTVIMTPHLLELARFSGMDIPEIKRDLLRNGMAIADRYHLVLVCKDAATTVFDGRNDGVIRQSVQIPRIYINQSGNDGLATAGSGDVLTGMIGGMLAKGIDGMESACMGVYLHGLCADQAVQSGAKSYLNAGDLADHLKDLLE